MEACPFCGSTEIVTKQGKDMHPIFCDSPFHEMFTAMCCSNPSDCGAFTGFKHTKEEAEAAWNRRAESCECNCGKKKKQIDVDYAIDFCSGRGR